MNGWRSGVVVGVAMEYWESSSMNGWRSGVVVGEQWNIGSHLV